MSYGRIFLTVKCVDLLEARHFSSRPYCVLNPVVEDEMHQVLVYDHLHPLGAQNNQRWHTAKWVDNLVRGARLAVGWNKWMTDVAWQEVLGNLEAENNKPLDLAWTDPMVIGRRTCMRG